ncbi:MAG: hypothetical protein AVDCRST_MAG85-2283, partial [uncultured Solirubrobacteraceae bacterium]
ARDRGRRRPRVAQDRGEAPQRLLVDRLGCEAVVRRPDGELPDVDRV